MLWKLKIPVSAVRFRPCPPLKIPVSAVRFRPCPPIFSASYVIVTVACQMGPVDFGWPPLVCVRRTLKRSQLRQARKEAERARKRK